MISKRWPCRHHEDKIEEYHIFRIGFGEASLAELPCRFPAEVL